MAVNRIQTLFNTVPEDILSVYFTAGFPELDHTLEIATQLAAAGVDLIEIGMPYSDPVADGPTIQNSNQQALQNGMSLNVLFQQLSHLRDRVDLPVILMGYVNPILQFGVKDFCEKCQQCGIDGLIIPDLPMQEYLDHYQNLFKQYGLHNIFLITPQTSDERIRWIDEHSDSFIYAVSDASITGSTQELSDGQKSYFKRLNALNLKHPYLIGFGIHDNHTFQQACQYARGAIIGSAFIKRLQSSPPVETAIKEFVTFIKPVKI